MHTKNLEKQLQEWRHDFHTCPELNFDLEVTSPKADELTTINFFSLIGTGNPYAHL